MPRLKQLHLLRKVPLDDPDDGLLVYRARLAGLRVRIDNAARRAGKPCVSIFGRDRRTALREFANVSDALAWLREREADTC